MKNGWLTIYASLQNACIWNISAMHETMLLSANLQHQDMRMTNLSGC